MTQELIIRKANLSVLAYQLNDETKNLSLTGLQTSTRVENPGDVFTKKNWVGA